jgi:hypothetical protein
MKASQVTVEQHVPNFVETGKPPKTATVTSLKELLALPWVAQWADPKVAIGHGEFYRFSVAEDGHRDLLIVERDEGRWWWVVARLRGDTGALDLPQWVAPQKPKGLGKTD